jgi:acetyl esterase/lipase
MTQQQYRNMDRAALDAAYDNSAIIGGVAGRERMFAENVARSRAIVEATRPLENLRYGARPQNRIDFFKANEGAPTLAFIHGGYWRTSDKEMHSFLAAGPLAHGISFANIEYTLTPMASLDEIVIEIKQAIAWLRTNLSEIGGNPEKLYLAGHSAGGHLTAMAIGEAGIRAGLSISGIFDLEPMRLSNFNDTLKLDEVAARRNSPIYNIPSVAPPQIIAAGLDELPEFLRQSQTYYEAWIAKGLDAAHILVPGHHFGVLEELAAPEGKLARAVVDMVSGKRPKL